MYNSKRPQFKWDKNEPEDPAMKKYLKPWDQETHDKFIKEKGMTPEQHDQWHQDHEKANS